MTLPPGINKIFLPLGILVFFAVCWYGLFKPEYDKISRYRAAPEASRAQIETMVRQLSAFNPPTEQERASWDSVEVEINRRLPQGRQITGLNSFLSSISERNGLVNFVRQEMTGSDRVYTSGGITRNGYNIELNFESEYGALNDFLADLNHSDRLLEVVTLEIFRNLPRVKVKLLLRSYYVPEEQN